MFEFLRHNYFLLTHSVEVLAAVIGLFYLKKYVHTAAKFLIYFLVYAFFIDILGRYPDHLRKMDLFYLIKETIIEKNYWWYTIFWFSGLTSFITYINYKIIDNLKYKKVLKYCYYAYLIQFILCVFFNHEALFSASEMFLKITSLLMITIAVIIYLVNILQSFRIIYFYKSIYFYINISIFLWVVITSPMMFYEIYFANEDWNFVILKRQIYLSINIIFYLTLSLALIFCKPTTK